MSHTDPRGPNPTDAGNIGRFRLPQQEHLAAVTRELAAGRKRSHWMWFMFPQVAGLGRSTEATRYAFNNFREATAFFLDNQLCETYCNLVRLVHSHRGKRTMEQIFGVTDAKKLRSSLTIFVEVCHQLPGAAEPVGMANALIDELGGPCPRTVSIVREWLGISPPP